MDSQPGPGTPSGNLLSRPPWSWPVPMTPRSPGALCLLLETSALSAAPSWPLIRHPFTYSFPEVFSGAYCVPVSADKAGAATHADPTSPARLTYCVVLLGDCWTDGQARLTEVP